MIYNDYTKTNDFPSNLDFPDLTSPQLSKRLIAQTQYENALKAWFIKYNIPQDVIDAWNAEAKSNISQSEKDTFWTRLKNKVQTAVTTVSSGTQAALNNAATIIDKGKEAALLILFAPFSLIAKKFLQGRNITPADTNKGLILQVYNEMSKKSFGYSQLPKDSFDYTCDTEELGIIQKFGLDGAQADQAANSIPITPEMVNLVISFLKKIFDSIANKKQKNEPLSQAEQIISDATPQIQEAINNSTGKATEVLNDSTNAANDLVNEEMEKGKFLGMDWKIWLAILILIVLFFFLRKK